MSSILGLFGISLGVLILLLFYRYIASHWEPLYREVVTLKHLIAPGLTTLALLSVILYV